MFASKPPSLLLLLLLYVPLPPYRLSRVAANRRYDHHVLGTSMIWPDSYDARAVIHSRFQVTRDGRVLLVSPRYRPGVPFTLGSFRATAARRAIIEPDVRPLPPEPRLHSANVAEAEAKAGIGSVSGFKARAVVGTEDNSSASQSSIPPLINVVDLCLDATMDVLWLLDVGTVDTMTDNPKHVAPAKIVRLEIDENDDDNNDDDCIYDPKTPYRTFEIKTEGFGGSGDGGDALCLQYLVTFQSRAADGGHYAFVSDAGRCTVLVLNTDTGVQWSVDFPERSSAAGTARDIMFMVLLRTDNGRAALYVTFMSGCRVYSVDLEHVDQCTSSTRPSVVEVGRKSHRITVLGSDAVSHMYFRRPAENEIWSWDVNFPFHTAGIRLVSVGHDCRAPVHVTPGYGGFVFVLANNFADYVRNSTGSLGAYTMVRPVPVLPPQPANWSSSAATTAPTASTTTAADDCECPT